MALEATAQAAAEAAVAAIGRGYDVAADIRLKYCKGKPTDPDAYLIDLGWDEVGDIVLPGGLTVADVPMSIDCDEGEHLRIQSDFLSFEQMSEMFNDELSLSGRIPSGMFNNMFDFSGRWETDARNTKLLAYDGWSISLYTVALAESDIRLCDHVTEAVPRTWDPAALARFIKKFGTHIVVAVKMGGKDVIYMKQQGSSSLQPVVVQLVQQQMKQMSDRRFLDASNQCDMDIREAYEKDKHHVEEDFREQQLRFVESSPSSRYCPKEDLVFVVKRRGGKEWDNDMPHNKWIKTVQAQPDVISMSFRPITWFLSGVPGSGTGYLSHAINLYLRYKPPIEELHQFLEFQLPRLWVPDMNGSLLRSNRQSSVFLPFNFIRPKLCICTNMVDAGDHPVTGLRLYLEGDKRNMLAINLQHLHTRPQIIQLVDDPYSHRTPEPYDRQYIKSWKGFYYIYTRPVESDDDNSIVTGAQLHVSSNGFRKLLSLRLRFSKVRNAAPVKNPEWKGSPNTDQNPGLTVTLATKPARTTEHVNINSAAYPDGPPLPVPSKHLKLVDTAEICRGPQDTPGYWLVSGAQLQEERGKVSLRVKYSLLNTMIHVDEHPLVEQS